MPFSSKTSWIATSAALALSVSMIVSSSSRSRAAVDEAARLLLVSVAHRVERHRAQRRVVHVGRDRQRPVRRAHRAGDEARPVRRLRASSSSAARLRDARALEVQLVDERLEAVVGLRRPRCALKVLVSMMSAPASRYAWWIPPIDVGPRQHQDVVVALEVVRVSAKRVAAEVGLRRACGAGSSCPWRRRGRGCGREQLVEEARISVIDGSVLGSGDATL